jgi:hypothetical protein
MIQSVPLVSLSPDYPTLILRTTFSIPISLMGFSFSAWGFLATFLDMWTKIYQLNIINQYLILISLMPVVFLLSLHPASFVLPGILAPIFFLFNLTVDHLCLLLLALRHFKSANSLFNDKAQILH